MQELKVQFTEKEYKRLLKAKKMQGICTWHRFVLDNCARGVSVDYNLREEAHPPRKIKAELTKKQEDLVLAREGE